MICRNARITHARGEVNKARNSFATMVWIMRKLPLLRDGLVVRIPLRDWPALAAVETAPNRARPMRAPNYRWDRPCCPDAPGKDGRLQRPPQLRRQHG